MPNENVEILVYGAEVTCPSCVGLPSSIETFEWLEAAITRKYPNQPFTIEYVDIHQPPNNEKKQKFAKKVIEEDLFYPVVVIGDKIVGEGNPQLKPIFSELESFGYK